jgi:hypothetical protein
VLNPDGSFTRHRRAGRARAEHLLISINNRKGGAGRVVRREGAEFNYLRKQSRYVPVALPESFGATITSAQTINDLNDIVGYYVDDTGFAKGWTAFTKLPSRIGK